MVQYLSLSVDEFWDLVLCGSVLVAARAGLEMEEVSDPKLPLSALRQDPEWHLAAVFWLDLPDRWWSQAGPLLLPEQDFLADQSP